MLLKPNMIVAGLSCPEQPNVDEVADATINCLLRTVPAAVSRSRLFGQFFRVLKWKTCSVRRRGGGNVKIGFIDFRGLVGRSENSSIVFRAFHKTGISTASLVAH
jgi:hypothetical protein